MHTRYQSKTQLELPNHHPRLASYRIKEHPTQHHKMIGVCKDTYILTWSGPPVSPGSWSIACAAPAAQAAAAMGEEQLVMAAIADRQRPCSLGTLCSVVVWCGVVSLRSSQLGTTRAWGERRQFGGKMRLSGPPLLEMEWLGVNGDTVAVH